MRPQDITLGGEGTWSHCFHFCTKDDNIVEGDETFFIAVSPHTDRVIPQVGSPEHFKITIHDDDGRLVWRLLHPDRTGLVHHPLHCTSWFKCVCVYLFLSVSLCVISFCFAVCNIFLFRCAVVRITPTAASLSVREGDGYVSVCANMTGLTERPVDLTLQTVDQTAIGQMIVT